MRFETDELYVKSPEEMIEYFKNVPDAIENTVKVAEKCNVDFEFETLSERFKSEKTKQKEAKKAEKARRRAEKKQKSDP